MSDVAITEIRAIDEEIFAAINRLLPQLSSSASALDFDQARTMIEHEANTLLVAKDTNGDIVGYMTLVVFPLPTGIRAWVEDVVVDESMRGQGVGEMLIRRSIDKARELGAKTVDLTSRPSREAANRLYQRVGFILRESNVYRYELGKES